jgi:hypothetical protein
MFLTLVYLVKDHPVFQDDGKKQRRLLSLHFVTLQYFGSTGSACSAHIVKEDLGIGVGSVPTYVA